MKIYWIATLIGLMLCGCLKDRTFDLIQSETDIQITAGLVVVNEICASGSTYTSEFGGTSPDWFEIFNPSQDTIILAGNRWYVTDDPALPSKYLLPEIKIAPHKFFVVCCDNADSVALQVHTNFSLSSNGESVGIYYKTDAGPYTKIDEHAYVSATAGISIGRIPDGTTNWANCSLMTPGTANQ